MKAFVLKYCMLAQEQMVPSEREPNQVTLVFILCFYNPVLSTFCVIW